MNGKILSHLSREGDKRIGQQGAFDPTALLNSYDRLAADAADSLRQLVERTYPDRVEEIKSQIHDRMDAADIADADETATLTEVIESLTVIAKFYHQVAGEIEAGTFRAAEPAMPPTWTPDLVMDFGLPDLSQFREGRLSPEYAKRARRARDECPFDSYRPRRNVADEVVSQQSLGRVSEKASKKEPSDLVKQVFAELGWEDAL